MRVCRALIQKTVASSLAAPLERRLSQIAGVSELTSVSSLGGCSINVQFDLNRDVNGAARDVQAAINAAARRVADQSPRARRRIAKSTRPTRRS